MSKAKQNKRKKGASEAVGAQKMERFGLLYPRSAGIDVCIVKIGIDLKKYTMKQRMTGGSGCLLFFAASLWLIAVLLLLTGL